MPPQQHPRAATNTRCPEEETAPCLPHTRALESLVLPTPSADLLMLFVWTLLPSPRLDQTSLLCAPLVWGWGPRAEEHRGRRGSPGHKEELLQNICLFRSTWTPHAVTPLKGASLSWLRTTESSSKMCLKRPDSHWPPLASGTMSKA